jgi:hypothetical protein
VTKWGPALPPTSRRRHGFPRAGDGSRLASVWPNTGDLTKSNYERVER